MRKQRKKTEGLIKNLIDEKSSKLDEKQGRKPIIWYLFVGVKNLRNLTRKAKKKTWCWLFKDRDKTFWSQTWARRLNTSAAALVFASFIGFFAPTATLSFQLFWNR